MLFHNGQKRAREDDDDELFAEVGGVEKKLRRGRALGLGQVHCLTSLPLPLRPCQYAAAAPLSPATITPTDSDGSRLNTPSPMLSPLDMDRDMNMNTNTELGLGLDLDGPDDEMLHSPLSPLQVVLPRPMRLKLQMSTQNPSGGRLPTPIHTSFVSLTATRTGSLTNDPFGPAQPEVGQETFYRPSRPRLCDSLKPYGANMHPLPSPISEGTPETPTTAAAGDQLSRLSVIGEESMEVDEMQDDNMSALSSTRMLDRHWERRPALGGQKRRFSMGYRDDCPKCRDRVPGHFSHFLSS